ncbi:MAG: antitoxin [Pseudonocardiaceae bacterium]
MPLLRKLTVLAGAAEAARRYARNNPDKVNRWADKAGQFVDKRTKGKYHKKIDNAVRKVHSSTGNMSR